MHYAAISMLCGSDFNVAIIVIFSKTVLIKDHREERRFLNRLSYVSFPAYAVRLRDIS